VTGTDTTEPCLLIAFDSFDSFTAQCHGVIAASVVSLLAFLLAPVFLIRFSRDSAQTVSPVLPHDSVTERNGDSTTIQDFRV
jgi:hypothetical protein